MTNVLSNPAAKCHRVWIALFAAALLPATACFAEELPAKSARQWIPVEWSLENPTHEGNPFDLVVTVTFEHKATGEKRGKHVEISLHGYARGQMDVQDRK